MDTLDLHSDDCDHYTFGRMPGAVTFVLDNPTVSRMHAVAQFRKADGALLLQDLGSTHGTFVNKGDDLCLLQTVGSRNGDGLLLAYSIPIRSFIYIGRIPMKPEWVELRVGDVVGYAFKECMRATPHDT